MNYAPQRCVSKNIVPLYIYMLFPYAYICCSPRRRYSLELCPPKGVCPKILFPYTYICCSPRRRYSLELCPPKDVCLKLLFPYLFDKFIVPCPINVYTNTCICRCMCSCIHLHKCVNEYVNIYIGPQFAHIYHINVYLYICKPMYVYTYICMCIHMYI